MLASTGAVDGLAGLVQPWASLYSEHTWLQTTIMFAHLSGIFLGADSFTVVVRQGSSSVSTAAPDQRMRGFEDLLDQPLIDTIYLYVRARSDSSLATGRPHRAPAAQ